MPCHNLSYQMSILYSMLLISQVNTFFHQHNLQTLIIQVTCKLPPRVLILYISTNQQKKINPQLTVVNKAGKKLKITRHIGEVDRAYSISRKDGPRCGLSGGIANPGLRNEKPLLSLCSSFSHLSGFLSRGQDWEYNWNIIQWRAPFHCRLRSFGLRNLFGPGSCFRKVTGAGVREGSKGFSSSSFSERNKSPKEGQRWNSNFEDHIELQVELRSTRYGF